ncbi:TerD family protein [Methylobacterium sp. 37f]|uniref:TerD family protein n=1 Tax=Methylobacterium sp. 37f TaxID=2817058 RepID=UPI001FFDCE5C|nr:TerD family protein [Methylobacterium sp. 37f]MCK2055269.1 TerD domain-containing protein [Methylobacterium sp. 37f]
MTSLAKGGNAPVPSGDLKVVVEWASTPGVDEIDAAAFLIGANGRVSGDADMIFYGQQGDRAVRFERAPTLVPNRDASVFLINTAVLPDHVQKVAFSGTIHRARETGMHFGKISDLRVSVQSVQGEVASFVAPPASNGETALVLGELYRRDTGWKFRAVGQGFASGLASLANTYGVDVEDAGTSSAPIPQPQPIVPPLPVPAPLPQPQPVVPPVPKPINLSKVSLTKERPSVSLEKRSDYGDVTVNLNWSRAKPGGLSGLFQRGSGGIDLDLGCLYELTDGSVGCVQALGDSFGQLDREPFVALDSDDRSGASLDGEWMRVNGRYFTNIQRLLVFAFIYDGVPNWARTDGLVTVRVPGEGPVEVRMEEGSNAKRMCAVALIENDSGRMRISREVAYFRGHDDMDRAYGWGLRWQAGSKD